MTATISDVPPPESPRGAQEVLWGLSGILFVALVACLAGYWMFGARLTAGLDAACAEAYFEAGQKFEASGNLSQAVLKYRQALGGQFENEELRLMCGRAVGDLLFKQDLFDEAVAAYQALPAAAFDRSGAYTGYVTALWRAGNLEEAAALGKTWLSLADSEGDADQRLWARSVLMNVAREQGQADLALEYGTQILATAPGNDAAITVARLLWEQGKAAEARACLETLLKNTDSPALQQAGRDLLEQVAREAAQPGQS